MSWSLPEDTRIAAAWSPAAVGNKQTPVHQVPSAESHWTLALEQDALGQCQHQHSAAALVLLLRIGLAPRLKTSWVYLKT